MLSAILFAALAVLANAAQAHTGETHTGTPWWTRWNWNPLILTNLAFFALLYGRGARALWGRAGVGRAGASKGRVAAFYCGVVALFVALISPLDVMSDQLSAAHMIQHMVIMMVAAPLIIAGAPVRMMLWGLPVRWRKIAGRAWQRFENWAPARYLVWQPIVLWFLFALTLWAWHLPVFYEAALRNEIVHETQHLMFFVAACLFWRVLLDPVRRLRLSRGVAVIYLFATSLHATALGVYMALSPRVWYSEYETRTLDWGLTAMQDQQLAGLIMWMPACLIYAVVAAILFGIWLREIPDQEEPARPELDSSGGLLPRQGGVES